MFICCNDDYVVTSYVNNLDIYLNENTVLKEFTKTYNYNISALQISQTFCVIGLFNGDVILLNLNDKNEHKIHKFGNKVSCIFIIGDFYYFGADNGKIIVFYINNADENLHSESSMFIGETITSDIAISNTDALNYKIVKEIQHNAPIVSIVNDGEKTYILDCKGKITLYGENKGFDISASCMIFCDYLFASENNMLYCKTETAFACRLQTEHEIKYFKFTKLGSVVFIKTENNIFVYNNNTLEKIRKVALSNGDFVFDEQKNRIIIYDGEKITLENNVIPHISLLSQKMEKIVFAATKIKEKKIKDKIDGIQDDFPTSKYVEPGHTKHLDNETSNKNRRKKTNITKIYSKTSDDSVDLEIDDEIYKKTKFDDKTYKETNNKSTSKTQTRLNSSKTKTYKNIDDYRDKNAENDEEYDNIVVSEDNYEPDSYDEMDNSSTYQNNNETVTYKSRIQNEEINEPVNAFTSGSLKDEINNVEILCYNRTGYVIKHEKLIEVIYHDNEYPKKEYIENFKIASVTLIGTLFANDEVLAYKSENEWTKSIKNIKLVQATNRMLSCVTENLITFFLPCGLVLYSALVQTPITICAENEKTVLFCKNEMLIFDQNLECSRVYFNFVVSFCDIESNIIYFINKNILYSVVNNIFIKLIETNKNPLCVNNKHLIVCNGNVFPQPNIEYYKIEKSNAIYNMYHSKEERESKIVKQIRDYFEKSDFNTSKELYSLLTLNENKEKFKNIFEIDKTNVKNSVLQHNRDDAYTDSQADKENSINLSLKVTSDIPEMKKTKRFNPFATKK